MLKKQKPFLVKGKAEILSGREEGRALAEKILERMEQLDPDSILPLDFRGVAFIDFSCADELLTRVLRRIISGELGTRFIMLQGMSPNIEENVSAVFTIRQLACPKVTREGTVGILGKIGTELLETYKLAARKGKITARDVFEIAPRVRISAISNRLAKLQKIGLLMRTREIGVGTGGRQFVYEPVC